MSKQQLCNYDIVICKIKDLLCDYSVTRAELSRKMGISRSAISQKLNGNIAITLNDVVEIANLFDKSTDWLLGREPLEVPLCEAR